MYYNIIMNEMKVNSFDTLDRFIKGMYSVDEREYYEFLIVYGGFPSPGINARLYMGRISHPPL